MARLQRPTGDIVPLPARCVLGRSSACAIQLPEREVSGEHALLRWHDGVWEVQDLQSRNGTFVDRQRIGDGERVRLLAGVALGFGRRDGCVLIDAGPPTPHAVLLDEQRSIVEAKDGLLVLPGDEDPEVIYRHREEWLLEKSGETRMIRDGEVVQASTGAWRLHLPDSLPATDEHRDYPTMNSLALRFAVSQDEKYIELVAMSDERSFDLMARSHHYLLLQLARARLADRSLPPDQQGWVVQDDVLRQYDIPARRLHLDVHRIRRQFAELGLAAPGQVIERRPGTRQLRIGVERLEVVKIERRDFSIQE